MKRPFFDRQFWFSLLVYAAVYAAVGGWRGIVGGVAAQIAANLLWDHIEGDAE